MVPARLRRCRRRAPCTDVRQRNPAPAPPRGVVPSSKQRKQARLRGLRPKDQITNIIVDAKRGMLYSILTRKSEGVTMRPIAFAVCALAVSLSISSSSMAADPAPPAGEARADNIPANNAPITFEEYRAWRLAAMERRLSEIDMQLATADLPAPRKARLEETRAYYKWLSNLPEAERDKRFRERFDRIDANHDGVIDAAERTACRERQRAYYGGRKREGQRPD